MSPDERQRLEVPLATCLDARGELDADLARAISEQIRGARHFTVVTGAGISAESGIPTFRDAQTGLWERYRPEELASPEAFARDPARVWQWYEMRRALVERARPNAGHYAIAALAEQVPYLTLVTQNVDGLHQQAGSRDVIEYHGNIRRTRCSGAGGHLVADWARDDDTCPPRCPECGAALRPDVVWFGERIPRQALIDSTAAAIRAEVLISVGTSAQVYPAALLASVARDHEACVIEVNLERTQLSDSADYVLLGESGKLLPALVKVLAAAAGD